MKCNRKSIVLVLSVAASILLGVTIYSVADEYHGHRGRSGKDGSKHHDKAGHGNSHGAQPAPNASYEGACGGCHWAYVPALLPSKSWANILATLNDHFGNEVVLTEQQRSEISNYLNTNSAENTSAKIGRKITQSLGAFCPCRVIDVPYVQKKHRKIDASTFSRKSIKSLSNCIACHPSASSTRFDDDDVKIPAE